MELLDIILLFPTRFKRILKHLVYFIYEGAYQHPCKPDGIKEWLFDLIFYILDIAGIAEIQQFVTRLAKWNIRGLNNDELTLARRIFGNAIDYSKIRIDDKAKIGIETVALAYVSFNTINYYQKIKKEILVHELVHIWQYQIYGSVYIGRAFKAQKSKEGYDYGGIENLYKVMLNKGRLMDFNFEQQAEIVEDYYRMIKNPAIAHPMLQSVYRYFVDDIK
ncbi:MAG: hypothetical protein IPK35_13850 [Saprospiraceae bacterium]|jgi:hypothetical protein|nr:hypothetical protein [Saprospiraceae bacterium]